MASKSLNDAQIVVGIDFGTSCSAYAYSYEYKQEEIFMNSNWPGGSRAYKETTAILLNENKEFIAFGEDAVEKFNYSKENEKKPWYFFNQFKMVLYSEKVSSLICMHNILLII